MIYTVSVPINKVPYLQIILLITIYRVALPINDEPTSIIDNLNKRIEM